MATVRAGYLFLLSEPVLEAGLTVVLSTAASEVGVTKNFGADAMLYGMVNVVIWHFTGFGELYRVLPKPHPTI